MLPVTVCFGRPSRAELLALSGCALVVTSAVVWARASAPSSTSAPADAPAQTALLAITSVPSAAAVVVDGHAESTTPATVGVTAGRHTILVHAPDAIDETRTMDVDPAGTSLAISL